MSLFSCLLLKFLRGDDMFDWLRPFIDFITTDITFGSFTFSFLDFWVTCAIMSILVWLLKNVLLFGGE